MNLISPGPTLTDIFAPLAGRTVDDEASAARVAAAFETLLPAVQPTPGMIRAADIATAAVFLASDEARFVNGHDLLVDGGICAGRPATVRRSTFDALREGLKSHSGS